MSALDKVKKGAKAVGNFGVGVAKGAGDTLMSVKRNVQKIPAEYTKLQVQKSMNSAREAINKANEPLLKKLKELPKDDPKRAKIKEMLTANQNQFAEISKQEDEIMAEIDNVTKGKIEIKDTDGWGTKLAARAQNLLNAADDSLKTTNKAQKAGFAVEKIAEFFVPANAVGKVDKIIKGGKVVQGTTKAGKALNSVVQIGGRAGFQGSVAGLTSLGQSAYQGNLDTPEGRKFAADEALKNAKSAAIATGVFDVAGRGIKALAKTGTESRLRDVKDSLSTVKTSYNKGVKYEMVNGEKVVKSDPIQTIMKTGVKPKVVDGKINPDDLIAHLDEQIQVLEDSRKSALNPNVKVPADEFRKVIEAQIRKDPTLQAQGKVNSTLAKLGSVIDDWKSHQGDDLTLDFIDGVRKNANKTWDPETADIMKKLGDGARKVLYDSDETVRPFLQEEGKIIAAKKFSEKLAGKAVRGGRLGKYFDQTAGAVIGSTGGPAGSLVGALAGNLVAKATQGQYFNPITGRIGTALEKAGIPKVLDKAIGAGVPRVLRPVSTNLGAQDPSEVIPETPSDIPEDEAALLLPEAPAPATQNQPDMVGDDGLTDEERQLLIQ